MRYIAFSKDNADFYSNLETAEKIGVCRDETREVILHNNADVAILDGDAFRVLRRERNYRHLKEIYLPLKAATLIKAFFYGIHYFVRGRLMPYDVVTFRSKDGAARRFVKIRVKSKKKRNSEFDYYPTDWTPMDFLRFLDGLNAKYVALRWHDKVINNLPMNDLDLLIADEDINRVCRALDAHVGTKLVHMHSVSGGEREKVDQMAYFPPKISRIVLDNRVPLTAEGGYRPSDKDCFLSLAYHAVVDKGSRCGLPESDKDAPDTENRYYKELTRLKNLLGLDVAINLEALATYIEEQGWLPPTDRLAKFVPRNPWLAGRINRRLTEKQSIQGDYTVFLFREVVRDWGILPELLADLKKMGFELVFEKELTDDDRAHVASEIRGGNWSPGDGWVNNGGKPFYAVLAYDPKPKKLSRRQMTLHPFIQNARLLQKQDWRGKVNKRFPKAKQANFVHTSDNTHEAHEYMSVIAPDALHLMK